jgi:hypothetical protein
MFIKEQQAHHARIMIDPVDRLPTEHDLHVGGDDVIANAGKRSAVQGRWEYTKTVQRRFSEKK